MFLLIAGLVLGGLGWVTVAALRVERAEQEAAARADAANKERLALWQLDSRLFPTLGVETNRPYAHYFSTYIPYPVVLPEGSNTFEPVQVPSPLLAGILPDWMLLHFQIDPDAGWSSPQVIAGELEVKLQNQSDVPLSLANVTPERRELLTRLNDAFPTEDVIQLLSDRNLSDLSDSPLAVPLSTPDLPASPKTPHPDAAPQVNPLPARAESQLEGSARRSISGAERYAKEPSSPGEKKARESS